MFIKTQNVRILTHTRTVTNYMLDLSSRQGGQPHNNNNNKTTTLLTTTRNRSRVSERLNAKTDWKTDHQLQTNSDSDNHFTLKIEAWRPSETLVFYRIITRCHNVQDLTCNVVVLISIHIWGGGAKIFKSKTIDYTDVSRRFPRISGKKVWIFFLQESQSVSSLHTILLLFFNFFKVNLATTVNKKINKSTWKGAERSKSDSDGLS